MKRRIILTCISVLVISLLLIGCDNSDVPDSETDIGTSDVVNTVYTTDDTTDDTTDSTTVDKTDTLDTEPPETTHDPDIIILTELPDIEGLTVVSPSAVSVEGEGSKLEVSARPLYELVYFLVVSSQYPERDGKYVGELIDTVYI